MLINRSFTYFFLASFISIIGGSVSYIAIYWAFSTKTSMTMLALLTTVIFLSRFLFYMTLGPITDRYEPRRLMRVTMLLRGGLLVFMGGCMYFWQLDLSWLLVMVVLQIALEALYSPASYKLIVRLVKEEEQMRANALFSLIDRTGMLIGLAVGGGIAAFLGLDKILVIEGIGYVLGTILLSMIQVTSSQEDEVTTKKENFLQEWKEGMGFIIEHKWMLAVLGLAVFSNLAITPTLTLLAPYTLQVLKGSAATYSYLEIVSIAGSMVIGFVLSKWQMKKINLAVTFSIACVLECAFMIVFGLNRILLPSFLYLFIVGAAVALFNIPFATVLQKYVPEQLLGRVRAGLIAVSTGASSLGYMMSGVLSDHIGVAQTIIWYGGVGLVGVITVLVFRPFRSLASDVNNSEVTVAS